MSMRKICMLLTCCLLASICSAQSKIKFKPRQIVVREAPFKTHAQAITTRALNHYPAFSRDVNFIPNKSHRETLLPNYRNELAAATLAKRLEPLANAQAGKTITFSGHFVPTKEELNKAAKHYTQPEFQTDAQQAVRDMFLQATRSTHGYGLVKVYETTKVPGAEPKMSILVLDLEHLGWNVYLDSKHNKNLSTQINPNKPTLFLLDDGKTAVLIHNQQQLRDIRDARGYLDENNHWVEYNQPFYIKFTPLADPIPLNEAAITQLGADVKVYKHYLLEFAASETGPFFNSMQALKAYLEDPQAWGKKANDQAILDRQRDYPNLVTRKVEKWNFSSDPAETPLTFPSQKEPTVPTNGTSPALKTSGSADTNGQANQSVSGPARLEGAQVVRKNGNQTQPVQTPFGTLTPSQYSVLSNDGKTGVLVYNQQDLYNIAATKNYYDPQTNSLLERQQPLYIELTTQGEPIELPQAAAQVFNIQSVYEKYTLSFAAYKGAPLFSTVKEVEQWMRAE